MDTPFALITLACLDIEFISVSAFSVSCFQCTQYMIRSLSRQFPSNFTIGAPAGHSVNNTIVGAAISTFVAINTANNRPADPPTPDPEVSARPTRRRFSYYVSGDLVQKSLKTTNERLARSKKKRLEYELALGDLHIASRTPLPTILEAFYNELKATRTFKSYKNDFSRLRVT